MTSVVIVSAILALIITGFLVFRVLRSYSMKHDPVDYPLDQFTKLNLQEKSDLFVGKQVTSRVISDDNKRDR